MAGILAVVSDRIRGTRETEAVQGHHGLAIATWNGPLSGRFAQWPRSSCLVVSAASAGPRGGADILDRELKDFKSQGRVRHQFIKRLHRRFAEEGIEIPFPIRTVVMQGPTATPTTP